MSRPTDLKAGDILLYRNFGWLGNLISWGSWNGTPGEALEYSHIGLVYDANSSVEMNPPASRKFLLSEVPWDRVDVFRLDVEGANPFDDPAVIAAFQAACDAHLGEGYDYGFIAQTAGLGVLARIGLGGLSRWIVSRNNPAPSFHHLVCSTWAEMLEEIAVRVKDLLFDLFSDLGDREAKPSDWPRSQYVKRISN